MTHFFRNAELHLPEIWAEYARLRPDHLAVIVGNRSWCWSELGAAMDVIAAALLDAGLIAGDRVGYLASNGFEALALTTGIIRAGLVAVPLSSLFTPDQLSAQLADAGARAFIAAGPHRTSDVPLPSGCIELEFNTLCKDRPGELRIDYSTDAPAVIIYSSGTTAQPKGIVHTLGARLNMATTLALGFRIDTTTTALVATPISSNATWMMLMPTLLVGGTFVWMPAFEPVAWAETAARTKATHAFAVPIMLSAILAKEPPPLPRLRALISAGSTLAPDLKRVIADRFGPVLFELYGCTEGVGTLLTPEAPPEKLATVGQPLPANSFMILGDDDRPAAPDAVGEIIGRGNALMSGYHERAAETARVTWTDDRGRDWLRTGDVGRIDSQGYLTILDRKKDMIVSGGLNVYPADIEAVIACHCDVAEVAVIGVPSERWGETPLALVVPRRLNSDPDAIMAWANARLGKHQRVAAVVFRERFPRNALGKVVKRTLRDEATRTDAA